MKDKLKSPKEITDTSNIISHREIDIVQCPFCLSLHTVGSKHYCKLGFHICSICGLDLHKKVKKTKGFSYKFKKSFKVWDKVICWECAFKIVKQFKS